MQIGDTVKVSNEADPVFNDAVGVVIREFKPEESVVFESDPFEWWVKLEGHEVEFPFGVAELEIVND